jgi:hypothetical protein
MHPIKNLESIPTPFVNVILSVANTPSIWLPSPYKYSIWQLSEFASHDTGVPNCHIANATCQVRYVTSLEQYLIMRDYLV